MQPVVEVVAELSLLDHREKIAIGRSDQADVDLITMRGADRLDFVGLDRAEQLRLEPERQLADLVEEQRSAVGRAEVAHRIFAGISERSAHVSEQLRFGQRLDQVGTVEGDERPTGRRAERMQRAGDVFLAGA